MRSITYVLCRKKSSAWGPIRSQFGEHVGPHQHAQHNLQWWRTCTEPLRAAAGSRAAVTAIGGDRHTKATWLRGRHRPSAHDGGRPQPSRRSHVVGRAVRTGAQRSDRCRCHGAPASRRNVPCIAFKTNSVSSFDNPRAGNNRNVHNFRSYAGWQQILVIKRPTAAVAWWLSSVIAPSHPPYHRLTRKCDFGGEIVTRTPQSMLNALFHMVLR